MEKISFIPTEEYSKYIIDPPKRSNACIPDWYKNTKNFIDNKDNYTLLEDNFSTSSSIKGCSPFLDSLTSGYMWCLPSDILIKKEENNYSIQWRVDYEIVSEHRKDQALLFNDKENMIFKWNFDFIVKTPKGYSTLFTHPMNRYDLPFQTFSGIVDTDEYNIPINFPFLIKMENNTEIILEKGTPLCQIIPFKRDNWKKEISESLTDIQIKKNHFNFGSKIKKSYKRQFWKKKDYL